VDPKTLSIVSTIEVRRDPGLLPAFTQGQIGPDDLRLTVGGGRVWYADSVFHAVLAIRPKENGVEARVIVPSGLSEIVYWDGSLWISYVEHGTVTRIEL
jgi:hypothetical protein